MNPNTRRRITTTLIATCLFEFIIITFIIVSAPPTPPRIYHFENESDLKSQAKAITNFHFETFPEFTKNFYVIFDSVEEACISIYASEYIEPVNAVDQYNYLATLMREIFPNSGYLLLLSLGIGITATYFLQTGQYPFASPIIMVISALLVSPPVSETIMDVGEMFFFYWTFPLLFTGIFFLFYYFLIKSFEYQPDDRINSRLKGILGGVAMMVLGGLVTVGSVAATDALGANKFMVGGSITVFCYGLYRVFYFLFQKEESNRTVGVANQRKKRTKPKKRSIDITFDYDFDSDLYMLSKEPDATNWEVILHFGNDEKSTLSIDKFSAYPGCDEHKGEASWLVEAFRPKNIEILRPGMEPLIIKHPDANR